MRLPSVDSGFARLVVICFVAVSSFFPLGLNRSSRDAVRDVAALRAELRDVRAFSASNAVCVLEALRAFREDYSAPEAVAGAVPDGAASVATSGRGLLPTLSGNYFSTASGAGACIAGHSYLVGDMSPWGIIDDAFRGGCVIDGQRYFLQKPSPERLADE